MYLIVNASLCVFGCRARLDGQTEAADAAVAWHSQRDRLSMQCSKRTAAVVAQCRMADNAQEYEFKTEVNRVD